MNMNKEKRREEPCGSNGKKIEYLVQDAGLDAGCWRWLVRVFFTTEGTGQKRGVQVRRLTRKALEAGV
jgi:hypothetical protein